VIHSLVEYADGSVLAQLGNPDMRTPIAHALAWPQRMDSGAAMLDLFAVAQLDFERPDRLRFPCLDLAYQALCAGGNAAAVLNAANEVAVAAFLDRRLPFLKIAEVIAAVLDAVPQDTMLDMAAVLEADRQGRAAANNQLAKYR
jgi:1-deoxy-D-xylulose-5-phosphate reductoisomerase